MDVRDVAEFLGDTVAVVLKHYAKYTTKQQEIAVHRWKQTMTGAAHQHTSLHERTGRHGLSGLAAFFQSFRKPRPQRGLRYPVIGAEPPYSVSAPESPRNSVVAEGELLFDLRKCPPFRLLLFIHQRGVNYPW